MAGAATHAATQSGVASAGIEVTGITMLLDSNTSFRLYFTCDDVAGRMFTLDGQSVEPTLLKGSKYYVELGRIGVANLGRWHEVAFDGDYKVEFSAAKGTGPRRPSRQTKCACGRGYVTVNRK